MDLDDLEPAAQLWAYEIAHAMRTLEASRSDSGKHAAALLAAVDTVARVRRLLPLMNLDPLHEADIRSRLHQLRSRIDVLSKAAHHGKR